MGVIWRQLGKAACKGFHPKHSFGEEVTYCFYSRYCLFSIHVIVGTCLPPPAGESMPCVPAIPAPLPLEDGGLSAPEAAAAAEGVTPGGERSGDTREDAVALWMRSKRDWERAGAWNENKVWEGTTQE